MSKINDMKSLNKFITETFLFYNTRDVSGRIYTKETVNDMYKQAKKRIDKGYFLGELFYPNKIEISPETVSHKIVEVELNSEDKLLKGTIEILDTLAGNKIMETINNDLKNFNKTYVIRPRGFGSVNKKGEVENYSLFSFDIISRDQDAFEPKNIKKY